MKIMLNIKDKRYKVFIWYSIYFYYLNACVSFVKTRVYTFIHIHLYIFQSLTVKYYIMKKKLFVYFFALDTSEHEYLSSKNT